MRKLLIAVVVLPAIAFAAEGAREAAGPGPDPARAEKRMRLARTLGLAEALDLDTEHALKLRDTLARFDDRRKALRQQAQDAREALRAAAQGGKAAAADVDGAIARLLDARAQTQALDKEMLQAVSQGLSPQQKARAALFMGSFRDRMERHFMRRGFGGPGGPGPGGPGGPDMMRGPREGRRGMMDGCEGCGRMGMRFEDDGDEL